MTFPVDEIRKCINELGYHFMCSDGHMATNWDKVCQGKLAEAQLQAMFDYIADLEAKNKEQAKCIADATFGGWYG